jgi:hypothetical protein
MIAMAKKTRARIIKAVPKDRLKKFPKLNAALPHAVRPMSEFTIKAVPNALPKTEKHKYKSFFVMALPVVLY